MRIGPPIPTQPPTHPPNRPPIHPVSQPPTHTPTHPHTSHTQPRRFPRESSNSRISALGRPGDGSLIKKIQKKISQTSAPCYVKSTISRGLCELYIEDCLRIYIEDYLRICCPRTSEKGSGSDNVPFVKDWIKKKSQVGITCH